MALKVAVFVFAFLARGFCYPEEGMFFNCKIYEASIMRRRKEHIRLPTPFFIMTAYKITADSF